MEHKTQKHRSVHKTHIFSGTKNNIIDYKIVFSKHVTTYLYLI